MAQLQEQVDTLRIAVVEDHEMARATLAEFAGKWKHGRVVLQAADGIDYERQCAELGHIHIALIDLRMPNRDGYETMRWMARHEPRTRPIAISYEPEAVEVRRALRAGARGVLSKACTPAALWLALDHVRTTGFHYNALVSRELRRTVQEEQNTPDELWASLTPREREFLLLYTSAHVHTLEEAARRMGISYETAESYRKHVASKLNCHTKAEMVRMVLEMGWGK